MGYLAALSCIPSSSSAVSATLSKAASAKGRSHLQSQCEDRGRNPWGAAGAGAGMGPVGVGSPGLFPAPGDGR